MMRILTILLYWFSSALLLNDFRKKSKDGETESHHDQDGDPVRRIPTDDRFFRHGLRPPFRADAREVVH